MTPAEIEALASAVMAEIERRNLRATLITATVTSYEFSEHATRAKASVHFPADPPGVNRQVSVMVAQPLNIGDVVIVSLAPMPMGSQVGYIMGVVAPPEVPAARVEFPALPSNYPGTVPFDCVRVQAGGMRVVQSATDTYLEVNTAGLYDLGASLALTLTSSPFRMWLNIYDGIDTLYRSENLAFVSSRSAEAWPEVVSLATPIKAGYRIRLVVTRDGSGGSASIGDDVTFGFQGYMAAHYVGPYNQQDICTNPEIPI